MNIRRSLPAVLAATGLAVSATLTVAAPAQAANGCSGTLVEARSITNGSGTKIGEIQLYWDAARGRNCASTVHTGSTWGVSLYTLVEVFVCPTGSPSSCKQGADVPSKHGDYVSYYVWEDSVLSSGRCVWARGWIDTGPTTYIAATTPGHCG
ncbi:hypothetical protein [Micromonospora auratinigra]|uniref:Secreted protein n=1 Tax=Micromonospora auratinigra TaxID=261654 RepID=A0A1A9A469_9ACTN|nr:hypothetical protein [Micromonospora auratinigra]SBT51007.1 hypothetical protein GA0070611_4982 [Micromonospora auratinigra]